MKKLLHERLREFENIGKDECALNNFYDLCLDVNVKNCKECHKTALNALADEIERDYIPREDHDREFKEIIEAQGGSFPSAHHVMKKWAEATGMKWPDNASITEFLDYYYIPRPRFEDGEPLVKGSELEDGIADGWCIWGDGAFEVYDKYSGDVIYGASQPELIKRPSPKVLDADGVPIKVGDTVWHIGDSERGEIIGFTEDNWHFDVKIQWDKGDQGLYAGEYLTHKEPVLDADGVPIKFGDKVYYLKDEEPIRYEVTGLGLYGVYVTDGEFDQIICNPAQLTHKVPDSLEKLLDDMLYDTGLYGTGYATRLSALIERGRQ